MPPQGPGPPALQLLRGSGLDTSNGPQFIQQRIALFAKIVGSIGAAFLVVGTAIGLAMGGAGSHDSLTAMITHVGGLVFLTAVWAIARRGRYSLLTLELLDAGTVVGCGLAWSFFVTPAVPDSIYWGVISVVLTVLARAVVVPSSAARTLRLTVLAVVPILVSIGLWLKQLMAHPEPAAFQPSLVTAIYQVLVLFSVVAMATITSRVIYDLRQKVREANELGPYILEEKLGVGGMGEVWRARHRFLVRAAAVKIIRTEPLMSGRADPEVLLRRFEREARATAALRSPHTVQLYDFGQAEDGTLYYVMEMLVGVDLEKLVARFGPVPAERAIHILKQICHSLAEAHENGLTHRDIKPANIWVSGIGSELDFVKVLDFGLVRLEHDRSDADQVKLTAEGSVGGTPAYMAPEIVLNEATYDHRVDIYAVGCIGYWLLTGKLVFTADNPMKMMLEHARTPPPPPSTRTELPIPPELEQIILDCLEKDPQRRPADAAELAGRLSRVPLPQQWTAERAEKWWRAHLPHRTKEKSVSEVLLEHEGSAPSERELRPRRAQ